MKRAAVPTDMQTVTGVARPFNSEEDAIDAIDEGKISGNDIVIIRYEGAQGAGMPEICLLYTSGLHRGVQCLPVRLQEARQSSLLRRHRGDRIDGRRMDIDLIEMCIRDSSIPMVVYAICAGESVGALFAGGIIPGLIYAACLMVVSGLICKKKGFGAESKTKYDGHETWEAFKDAIWALLVPVICLLYTSGRFQRPSPGQVPGHPGGRGALGVLQPGGRRHHPGGLRLHGPRLRQRHEPGPRRGRQGGHDPAHLPLALPPESLRCV